MVALLSRFLDLVVFLGNRIPQIDLKIDYLTGLLWAVLLGLTILSWPIRREDKKALLWIWLVKCILMLGLMLFYEYRYQIDSFGLFSGARYDMSEWKKMELIGSLSVVFITWLHQHLFLDSFHAVKISFGMIGLIGIYIFYRAAVVLLRREIIGLLYILALFPSILFWSSTIGKEPLMLLAIAIYCYGTIKYYRSNAPQYLIIAALGIAFAAFIRLWLGVILVIPLSVFCFIRLKNMKLKILLVVLLLLSVVCCSKTFLAHFRMKSIRAIPHYATRKCHDFSRGGSVKDIKRVKFKNGWDMLYFIPRGMGTALFRPLPGEVNNPFGIVAGLENALLVILFVLAIKRTRWRKLSDPLYVWAILLVAIWAAVYGFIAFNLGTICRYRVQILPVFLGLILYQIYSGRKSVISESHKLQ